MESWWDGLTTLNRGFFVGAVFFSVLSIWQTLSALLGVGGHSHAGSVHGGAHISGSAGHGHAATPGGHGHVGVGHHTHTGHHHSQTGDRVAFSLVSVRSSIAFGTLFSWSGALYLAGGSHPALALLYSVMWGGAGMFTASYAVYRLLRLQEVGNPVLESALGEEGTIYIEIPTGGIGQVRVMLGGIISHIKACAVEQAPLVRGTRVRIVGTRNNNILEVERLDS